MSGIAAIPLSYDERLFLVAYKKALGKEYRFDDTNRDEHDLISRDHIQAQKIGYFLNVDGFLPDYCFSWNQRGPFSSRFQELLANLDTRKSQVSRFYKSYDKDTDIALTSLLPQDMSKRLDQLSLQINSFAVNTHESNQQLTDNLELLGSMLYIAVTVLPGQGFRCISGELKSRKASFNNSKMNKKAWDCLQAAHFVSA